MRKFLICFLIAAAPAPLAAADWRVVAIDGDSDMGAAIAFVDVETVVRAGAGNAATVTFVMDVRFSRPPEPGWDGLRATMRAECAAHRWESSESGLYNGAQAISHSGPTPMETSEPETNGYKVIDAVCGGQYMTGSVDPIAHARGVFAGQ